MKKVLMAVAGISLALNCTMNVQASGQVEDTDVIDDVIDERWGVPILAHGSALTEEQLAETEALLEITGTAFDKVDVSGEDMVHFLGSGNPQMNMFSSALITRGVTGSGIQVVIVTPDNITRITESQYINAMITAGITDSTVYVASPVRVTGESALVGIYKAYADRGEELDTDRMVVAQQELEVTSDIANEHADNEEFNPSDLDNALIEIKVALADIKESMDKLATEEEVRQIVEDALQENNLDTIVTPEQTNSLVRFAASFQETDAVTAPEVREQLNGLSDAISGGLSTIRDGVENSGIISNIQGFFSRIGDTIKGFFTRSETTTDAEPAVGQTDTDTDQLESDTDTEQLESDQPTDTKD